MGKQKLLLPWAGKPLLRHLVDELLASRVHRIVVVLGAVHDEVRTSLKGAAVAIVTNPKSAESGMLSSVRIGLEATVDLGEAFMVVLGDQPSLSARLVDELIAFWEQDKRDIVRPVFRERHGHPVLIPVAFRARVLQDFDEVGLKGLLRTYPERVRELKGSDQGVVTDVDTPEDYERERRRLNG